MAKEKLLGLSVVSLFELSELTKTLGIVVFPSLVLLCTAI
ncbi:hypothetical protein J2Z25_002290 [Clostridium tertium]|nr:hypothetical protein [Clostridium tertium]